MHGLLTDIAHTHNCLVFKNFTFTVWVVLTVSGYLKNDWCSDLVHIFLIDCVDCEVNGMHVMLQS